MIRLNKLFLYTGEADPLDAVIEPTSHQRAFLTQCKNYIRDHLYDRIRQASKTVLGMEKMVSPRFRTQGSWSYGTCLQPAFQPPQEMDWDFGVYLPAATWENHQPRVAARAYFDLVEGMLKDLCEKKGWRLVQGTARKETCIRIEVASWAHIDIPLYAAPEAQFNLIRERALAMNKTEQFALDSITFAEAEVQFAWRDLTEIVMATRSGEWKASDPGAVTRWFDDVMERVGERQLRRICRYLKAWRDHVWRDGGGPTSILLMIVAAQGFEAKSGRDDLALEHIAGYLSRVILGAVHEPGIDDGHEDFNRLTVQERTFAAQKARELQAAIHRARNRSMNERYTAIQDLRAHYGERIPLRMEWIEPDGYAEAVRSTPAVMVPVPRVESTKAG